jgi:hypothetical protein
LPEFDRDLLQITVNAMPNDWIAEQRERLGESERRLSQLKAELIPARQQEPPRQEQASSAITLERLRRRRFWIVVLLSAINLSGSFRGAYGLIAGPSSATLMLPRERVLVSRDATGKEWYMVDLPLNEFPYNVELEQRFRSEFLWSSLGNFVLLLAILHSYWQQSKLLPRHGKD